MQVQIGIRKCGFESTPKTQFFSLTLKSASLLLHSEKFLDVASGPRDREMRNIWRGPPPQECLEVEEGSLLYL